jgi:dihydroorotate dehydrogenase
MTAGADSRRTGARPAAAPIIDLAPNHKLGLVVTNPILLGAGAVGYGEAIPRGLDLAQVGAAVVGPVLGSSRGGSPPPRLAHVNGGIVLDTGLQNRGVNNAIQQYGKLWEKLGCPIVVQVAESHPGTLAKVAGKLAGVRGVQGLELLPAPDVEPGQLAALVRTLDRACELPIWVKLPLARAAALAPVVVGAGAVGVVVGQAPMGAGLAGKEGASGQGVGDQGVQQLVRGALYGPLVFPLMLGVLQDVAALRLSAALIACGGIHTAAHVLQALDAGAQAVQIDSLVWVEPGVVGRLVALW